MCLGCFGLFDCFVVVCDEILFDVVFVVDLVVVE